MDPLKVGGWLTIEKLQIARERFWQFAQELYNAKQKASADRAIELRVPDDRGDPRLWKEAKPKIDVDINYHDHDSEGYCCNRLRIKYGQCQTDEAVKLFGPAIQGRRSDSGVERAFSYLPPSEKRSVAFR